MEQFLKDLERVTLPGRVLFACIAGLFATIDLYWWFNVSPWLGLGGVFVFTAALSMLIWLTLYDED